MKKYELPSLVLGTDNLPLMIQGLPGNMATEIMNNIFSDFKFTLIPYSLTGQEITKRKVKFERFSKTYDFNLIKPKQRGERIDHIIEMEKSINGLEFPFIAIDFTTPDVVNDNCDFYCRKEIPFVMGTTGGDRGALEERVKESNICAVIAPNMAKQIVALQDTIDTFSNENEGILEGRNLVVYESHQKGKVDTSGTARAMVRYFKRLGMIFDESMIEPERTTSEQIRIGVPKSALKGHAWHTYVITSEKGQFDLFLEEFGDCIKDFLVNDSNKIFQNYRLKGGARKDLLLEEKMEMNLDRVLDRFGLGDRIEIPYNNFQRISNDKTVGFSMHSSLDGSTLIIEHNVNGRSIYAKGTMDAVDFLQEKIRSGERGKV